MFRKCDLIIFELFAILAFVVSASAQMSLAGEVTDVIDGRTVVVSIASGKIKVQLQYIDVPETGQELHDIVKEHLRGLVAGKTVDYRPRNILDDRMIGQITLGNVDLSQQMLRDGAAWHIPSKVSGQELGEYQLYASIESATKTEKLGIWAIAGLKPAWDVRAENKEKARREEEESWISSYSKSSAGNSSRNSRNSNPAFRNVGALLDRYDPESMTGLLSTSYMPIEVGKDQEIVERIGIAITYYYEEGESKKRKGSFVVSVAFLSKKVQFAGNNELTIWDNGKITVVGKPKRFVSVKDDGVHETLAYGISRLMLERAAGNDGVFMKVGNNVIHLTGGRYLVYNLLQVTQ